MLKSLSLTHLSFLSPHTHNHTRLMSISSARFLYHSHFLPLSPPSTPSPCLRLRLRLLSTNPTPYPLQYEMIINRPDLPKPRPRRPLRPNHSSPEPDQPTSHLDSLDNWVDDKIASEAEPAQPGSPKLELDKAKRKYYNKRRKRMYGSDSDDDNRRPEEKFVELKPEVVDLPTLHRREEELYFYDAFAYPWEKEKHYKMVYQLEKKYFPDQCLDKAFLQPGQGQSNSNSNANSKVKKKAGGSGSGRENKDEVGVGDNKLVFFEEKEKGEIKEKGKDGDACKDLTEKKVEEFFKGLKKVPNKDVQVGEPYLTSRRTGLPPVWDSPHGTVLLVNKPKGWTSFTVCGKLRRIVKVKKVGHAGTLDPMATGLLIVCVGKATKLVESYQGMVKGYSGVFRLGEATSTWDADSPASLICRSFSVSHGSTSKMRT